MKPVALVVQRCHPDAVGGAEDHAWQFARLIASERPVEILTTCAIDAEQWDPVLKPGLDQRDGIPVRRFKNKTGHSAYWHALHDDLLQKFFRMQSASDLDISATYHENAGKWKMPRTMQEEWLRHQGPDAPDLYDFIRYHGGNYSAFLFITYLFPTTYMGMLAAPVGKSLLLSTLHDEPPAYLPIYREQARRARMLLFNTNAEAELARRLWGPRPGRIVAMAIGSNVKPEQEPIAKTDANFNTKEYLLYLGRIDPGKGCQELCDFFKEFIKQSDWKGELLLAGNLQMDLPRHPRIRYLGFLPEADKQNAIQQARALVMPSPYESLSIVALEAMLNKTPVLMNGRAAALREHVRRSDCGLLYTSFNEFCLGINAILCGQEQDRLQSGHDYVHSNFSESVVRTRLLEAIDQVSASIAFT